MNNLLPEERETCLTMMGTEHNIWLVFSDDPVMMRKLDQIAEVLRVVGTGKEYRLEARQVRLTAKRKPLSATRKAQLAKQAELMRKSLVNTRTTATYPHAVDEIVVAEREATKVLEITSAIQKEEESQ